MHRERWATRARTEIITIFPRLMDEKAKLIVEEKGINHRNMLRTEAPMTGDILDHGWEIDSYMYRRASSRFRRRDVSPTVSALAGWATSGLMDKNFRSTSYRQSGKSAEYLASYVDGIFYAITSSSVWMPSFVVVHPGLVTRLQASQAEIQFLFARRTRYSTAGHPNQCLPSWPSC